MENAIVKSKINLTNAMAVMQKGWKIYEDADPDPVYRYLARVYKVVRAWPKEQRAKYARELRILAKKKVPAKSEPFAIVIICTSEPEWVDNKLRNRWSRALQFADEHDVYHLGLRGFIQNHGGLAKCAKRLSK